MTIKGKKNYLPPRFCLKCNIMILSGEDFYIIEKKTELEDDTESIDEFSLCVKCGEEVIERCVSKKVR